MYTYKRRKRAISRPDGYYFPTTSAGRRTEGWEDINVTHLAADAGVSLRYLLGVLKGQRNCTFRLLQELARLLRWPTAVLVDRIESWPG